jgi:hypothetical protein
LIGTASAKLYLKQNTHHELTLCANTDADYAAQESDRKSISAATVHLNGLLVNWYCTKQNNVSLSTMESEYVASARGVQDLLGCYELLQEVGCITAQPMTLYMDNQAAIAQIQSEASSQNIEAHRHQVQVFEGFMLQETDYAYPRA